MYIYRSCGKGKSKEEKESEKECVVPVLAPAEEESGEDASEMAAGGAYADVC
jgi:hypothetical protein